MVIPVNLSHTFIFSSPALNLNSQCIILLLIQIGRILELCKLTFFGIAVYLSFRFQRDYAFFAIVALLHDVLITLGVFAVLGLIAGVEVDSLFLVSLLTIVGFSVNDTVVIYDRVRENFANTPELSVDEIVDNAVSQTLTRSINTTLTTLLPLVAIFLFGGSTLK